MHTQVMIDDHLLCINPAERTVHVLHDGSLFGFHERGGEEDRKKYLNAMSMPSPYHPNVSKYISFIDTLYGSMSSFSSAV